MQCSTISVLIRWMEVPGLEASISESVNLLLWDSANKQDLTRHSPTLNLVLHEGG